MDSEFTTIRIQVGDSQWELVLDGLLTHTTITTTMVIGDQPDIRMVTDTGITEGIITGITTDMRQDMHEDDTIQEISTELKMV